VFRNLRKIYIVVYQVTAPFHDVNPYGTENFKSQRRMTSVGLLHVNNLEPLTLPKRSLNFESYKYIKVSGAGDHCLVAWMASCCTRRWLPWLPYPFVGGGGGDGGGGSGNDWEVAPTVVLAVKSH
jgi:hypothetical protein